MGRKERRRGRGRPAPTTFPHLLGKPKPGLVSPGHSPSPEAAAAFPRDCDNCFPSSLLSLLLCLTLCPSTDSGGALPRERRTQRTDRSPVS